MTDNRREDRPSAGGERWNVATCAGWHHRTPGHHRPGQRARRRWRLLATVTTAPRAPTLSIRVATTMSPAWSPTTPTRGCSIGASTRAGNSQPPTILQSATAVYGHRPRRARTGSPGPSPWTEARRAGGGAGSANSDLRPPFANTAVWFRRQGSSSLLRSPALQGGLGPRLRGDDVVSRMASHLASFPRRREPSTPSDKGADEVSCGTAAFMSEPPVGCSKTANSMPRVWPAKLTEQPWSAKRPPAPTVLSLSKHALA